MTRTISAPAGGGGADPKLTVDGVCGAKTRTTIQKFQIHDFGWKLADGRVDPSWATLIRMNEFVAMLE